MVPFAAEKGVEDVLPNERLFYVLPYELPVFNDGGANRKECCQWINSAFSAATPSFTLICSWQFRDFPEVLVKYPTQGRQSVDRGYLAAGG